MSADDFPTHELIFYSLHEAGRVVQVSAFARGLAANCRCGKCQTALIAVQGRERIHHFRHGAGFKDRDDALRSMVPYKAVRGSVVMAAPQN